MQISSANFAFLGFCDFSEIAQQVGVPLPTFNVMGLNRDRGFYVFPTFMTGIGIAFAVYNPTESGHFYLKFCKRESSTRIQVRMELEVGPGRSDEVEGWVFSCATFPGASPEGPPPLVEEGVYDVWVGPNEQRDDSDALVGKTFLYQVATRPFSEIEAEAIKRDYPTLAKTVLYVLGCPDCKDQIKIYAGIERSPDREVKDQLHWNLTLPEEWICKCGKAKISLSSAKQGLHGYLRHVHAVSNLSSMNCNAGLDIPVKDDNPAPSLHWLFMQQEIPALCTSFQQLISKKDVHELEVHKFLKQNTVFFRQFRPRGIILSERLVVGRELRRLDFALRTGTNELLLIEIESPRCPLLKEDGHLTAELNHAFMQVAEWRAMMQGSQDVKIEVLGFDPREVIGTVPKGVVIAGRLPQDAKSQHKLRSLVGQLYKDIDFFTYDDIIDEARRFAAPAFGSLTLE